MKKLTQREWLLLFVIVVALFFILLFIFRKVKVPGKSPLEDHLERLNDSLGKADKKKEVLLKQADNTIDSLELILKNTDGKIEIQYITTEKIVAAYDTLSPEQLQRILSDRYPRTGR